MAHIAWLGKKSPFCGNVTYGLSTTEALRQRGHRISFIHFDTPQGLAQRRDELDISGQRPPAPTPVNGSRPAAWKADDPEVALPVLQEMDSLLEREEMEGLERMEEEDDDLMLDFEDDDADYADNDESTENEV